MSELSAEFVRSILRYEPETGSFYWRAGYARCVTEGRPAGRVNGKGYASISICGKHRSSHRLAWLYVYGEWPDRSLCVDHINGDKTDNRISNLRIATFSENAQNRRKQLDGLKGVTLHRATGRWQAQISPSGRSVYLGLFDSPEEAHAAYVAAAEKYFGSFARAA